MGTQLHIESPRLTSAQLSHTAGSSAVLRRNLPAEGCGSLELARSPKQVSLAQAMMGASSLSKAEIRRASPSHSRLSPPPVHSRFLPSQDLRRSMPARQPSPI